MRGMEVKIIWVCMKQKLIFVGADSNHGQLDHLFAVTMDGVHCKRYVGEVKGGLEFARYGFGEEDTVAGLYAMRQYRKVQKDVIAYIKEQQEMAA